MERGFWGFNTGSYRRSGRIAVQRVEPMIRQPPEPEPQPEPEPEPELEPRPQSEQEPDEDEEVVDFAPTPCRPIDFSDTETQSVASAPPDFGSEEEEENHPEPTWRLTRPPRRGVAIGWRSRTIMQSKALVGGGLSDDLGVVLSREEMLKNSLLYLLLLQQKKIPAKKADIIKYAMSGQSREFEEVFKELGIVLNEVFGMKVCGVGATQKSGLSSNYIIASNYKLNVCDMVTIRDHDIDTRRSIIFLILITIFMLNRNIDEDTIWKIMVEAQFNMLVCGSRQNLRKFLRDEFISTMYLEMEENKDTDPPTVRYGWGARANHEFSRYAILKFVAREFPGKRPSDFPIQYGIVKELEGDLVAADAVREALDEGEEGAEDIPTETEEESVPMVVDDVQTDHEHGHVHVVHGRTKWD